MRRILVGARTPTRWAGMKGRSVMDDHDLVQTIPTIAEAARWWDRPRTRAEALKFGAAAGIGLGLLNHAGDTHAASSSLSGTLSLTWFYAPAYTGALGKST